MFRSVLAVPFPGLFCPQEAYPYSPLTSPTPPKLPSTKPSDEGKEGGVEKSGGMFDLSRNTGLFFGGGD